MKPAVLYSPEASEEEEIVHTAATSNDIDKMKCAQQVRGNIEVFTNRDRPDTSIPISSSIDNVPVELCTLIHWIMVGPVQDLEDKKNQCS